MFESRLFFVDRLIDMGAQIILCDRIEPSSWVTTDSANCAAAACPVQTFVPVSPC
jgi:UDP-N-acetylglucosamine enolpyruvyl transferase